MVKAVAVMANSSGSVWTSSDYKRNGVHRQRRCGSTLTGGRSSRGSPTPSALTGAQRVARLRRGAPGRCARQCSDQGFIFIAMHNTVARQAMPTGMTTAARSRARGSRALFPSRVRERGPLDELTGVLFTPLRFGRCTQARSSPRSPAMPEARAAKEPMRIHIGSTAASVAAPGVTSALRLVRLRC